MTEWDLDFVGRFILLGRCLQHLGYSFFQSAGTTSSQSGVLMYLALNESKDVYNKDIEKAFQIRPSSVTGLLERLERQDYIFRVPSVADARLKSIKLTEKGRTIMHEVLEARQKLLTQLKGDISDEDIRKFTAICDEMIHHAKG